MRYLGVDFGSKKIGLALSDEGGVLAFPDTVIANTPAAVDHLVGLIAAQGVEEIVFGESRDYAGNANVIMGSARAFAAALEQASGRPVRWHTEVLTSAHARRGGEKVARPRTRTRRSENGRPSVVDASAAAIMLQSFLDLHGTR